MTTDQTKTMNEVSHVCPGGFMGRPSGGDHFWSQPTADGHQECLWCRARRQLKVVPMEEPLRRLVVPLETAASWIVAFK